MIRKIERTLNTGFLNSLPSLRNCCEDRTNRSQVTAVGKSEDGIHIKSFCEADRGIWNNFVLNSRDSTFFHLIEWRDVIERSFGHKSHYIMALQNDNIVGILPLFEIKSRLFGHSLVSVPFGVYGGVCAIDENVESVLYRSAATLGKLMNVDYVELRNHVMPSHERQDWLIKNLYVTFQREIYPDIERNFNAIPRKQRRMIRQGIKAGLISKIGRMEYIDDFYKIYAKTYKRHGTPVFSLKFLKNIMDTFPKTFILSVWKGNQMIAGVMSFVFKKTIMPYFAGALKEYFHYAVNDFMYWELMRYASQEGFKIFDFGRSKKDTGSYDFKRHWGFEPSPLPYHYYLVNRKEIPNVSPVNPKYSFMINIWKRLPLPVINWLGPKIIRNIP
jgi:FemAB-related protein (PEP-CTERM system-associated)